MGELYQISSKVTSLSKNQEVFKYTRIRHFYSYIYMYIPISFINHIETITLVSFSILLEYCGRIYLTNQYRLYLLYRQKTKQ